VAPSSHISHCRAFLGKPNCFLLDEPTEGSPAFLISKELRFASNDMKEEGIRVLLVEHISSNSVKASNYYYACTGWIGCQMAN